MPSVGMSVEQALARLYAEPAADATFAAVLRSLPVMSEDDLCDLIEADGRARIESGRPVSLDRYLSAMPELRAREVALDTAIDVTLRCYAGQGMSVLEAVDRLLREHPDLASAINDAVMLERAILATDDLREGLLAAVYQRFPADFGPPTSGGRPRYELRKRIGQGTSGEVYLAVDRQLSDPSQPALVAIKILRSLDRGPWARQRLVDEATKARRVHHPHVARVLDLGVSPSGDDYIVYEYVDGGDLDGWLKDHPGLSVRDRVSLVARVARGMQAAHAANLVHCDLKPGNILVTADGEPKVTDFGIAVRAEELADSPATPGSGPMGNPAFVSPEQFRREDGSLTFASDMYALGGILYNAVSGDLPNGESLTAITERHHTQPPPPPPSLRSVDPDLDRICGRALEALPDKRYVSAALFADDLDRWLKHEPIGWARPGARRRLGLWRRRRPAVAWLAFALAAAVILGGGASWYWSVRASASADKARQATALKESARTGLKQIRDGLMKMRESQTSRDALLQSVALQALHPEHMPELFSGGSSSASSRIVALKGMLNDERARGHDRHIEFLIWQEVLGMWLLHESRYLEAQGVLHDTLPLLEGALHRQDDPIVWEARIAHACAVVLADEPRSSTFDSDRIARLRSARVCLDGAPDFLREYGPLEALSRAVEAAQRRLMQHDDASVSDTTDSALSTVSRSPGH